MLYCDIKAENVLVTTDVAVKVAHFGLTHHLDGFVAGASFPPSLLGTSAYSSPERLTSFTNGKLVAILVRVFWSLPFNGNGCEEVLARIAKGKLAFSNSRFPWCLQQQQIVSLQMMLSSPLRLTSVRRGHALVTRLVLLVAAMHSSHGDHFQTSNRNDLSTPTQVWDIRIPAVDELTTDGGPVEKGRERNRKSIW